MPLRMKRVRETFGKDVYVEDGDYFGKVQDLVIKRNKVSGWKLTAEESSILQSIKGAKGVIVPHQLVKAVGDILIISKAAIPSGGGEELSEEVEEL